MSTVFLTEKQFQISLDSIRLTKYFVVVMKQKKSDTVITIVVTIHSDDTQSVEVKGGYGGSMGPMDTLWGDVESSLRVGLMDLGIIDQTGIGDWEV